MVMLHFFAIIILFLFSFLVEAIEFSSFKFEKSNPIEIELIIEIELAIHAI